MKRTMFDRDGGLHKVSADNVRIMNTPINAPDVLHVPFGHPSGPILHECVHAGSMACNLLTGRFATIALSMPGADRPIGVYVGLSAVQLRGYAETFTKMAGMLDAAAGKQ